MRSYCWNEVLARRPGSTVGAWRADGAVVARPVGSMGAGVRRVAGGQGATRRTGRRRATEVVWLGLHDAIDRLEAAALAVHATAKGIGPAGAASPRARVARRELGASRGGRRRGQPRVAAMIPGRGRTIS